MENGHWNYIIYFSKGNTEDYYFTIENEFDFKFDIDKTKEKISNKRLLFEDLYDNCRLYREAIVGKYWLYHNEMFGLMTSLLQIDGGSSKIKEILNSRIEYSSKIDSWNAMKTKL